MAVSNSFFGARRGSTKSATYSTRRGTQVTKDRQGAPANPQSDAQMRQRIRTAMVTRCRDEIKGLVNHSWEYVPDGEQSLAKFMSVNMAKTGIEPTLWLPKDVTDAGEADYLVSGGTLPTLPLWRLRDELYTWEYAVIFNGLFPGRTMPVTGNKISETSVFNLALSVLSETATKSQISILAQVRDGTYKIEIDHWPYELPKHRWVLYRLSHAFDLNATKATLLQKGSWDGTPKTGDTCDYEIKFKDGGFSVGFRVIYHRRTTANGGSYIAIAYSRYWDKDSGNIAQFMFHPHALNNTIAWAAIIHTYYYQVFWHCSPQRLQPINPTYLTFETAAKSYTKSSKLL